MGSQSFCSSIHSSNSNTHLSLQKASKHKNNINNNHDDNNNKTKMSQLVLCAQSTARDYIKAENKFKSTSSLFIP